MTGLMQWITSFNCCRTSILLLLLNAFLKVKAVYFKLESTISDFFYFDVQHAHWCTTHLHFLHHQLFGVEGPFLEEVVSSSVFWRNCHLAGCVEAFSQILKCFFKLLAQLMVLLQYGRFFLLMVGSQWCCFSTASLEKNLAHLLHFRLVLSIKYSISSSIYRISSSALLNMPLSWSSIKVLLQLVIVGLI